MSISLSSVREGDWGSLQQNLDAIADKIRPPKPNARVYNSANITIPSAINTFLTFNQERWNVGNMHSTATNPGRLTAKITGLYTIGFAGSFVAAAGGVRQIAFRLNGATFIAAVMVPGAGAAQATQITLNTSYRLVAGDYVEVMAQQDSVGPVNLLAAANFSPEFWMVRESGYTNEGIA